MTNTRDIGVKRICMVAALLAVAPAVPAQQAKVGEIRIEAAFARATPGGVKDGAAFMTLHNAGAQSDRLVAVKAANAARVQLHNHVMEGGVARMREVPGLDVPAGARVELKPGGYHLMMLGLKAPMKEGDSVPLELRFERSGSVVVNVPVKALGATARREH